VCTGQSLSVIRCCTQYNSFDRLSVSRPVEQPGLLRAGKGIAEFFSFTSDGGLLKLFPSKLPFLSATRCDSITVHRGAQVGMDPESRTVQNS